MLASTQMYVCMYTMILPLHFSVPIYSPWQKKKKKKKKNTQKIKRGAGPLPGPEYIYLSYLVPYFTNFTKNTLKTRNFDYP